MLSVLSLLDGLGFVNDNNQKQDLRNFEPRPRNEKEIVQKTQTVPWHRLTVYATEEQRA